MKVRRRVQSIADDHRVTTFELFFDLVFVFAFTQLTAYMTHDHTAAGIVQAMLLLALFWWSWSAYAWLGNQANAAVGTVRAVMLVAMTAVFILALATPEAWHDAPGGLHWTHRADGGLHRRACGAPGRIPDGRPRRLRLAATAGEERHPADVGRRAAGDRRRRRRYRSDCAVGTRAAADWGATYLTSRGGGGWRINSRIHWVERHSIVIILALGESIVAIGTGASGQPISWTLLAAAVLGILIAAALWWLYFDVAADAAEESLGRREGTDLVKTVINAYSYGHFVLIAGIVVVAFGVEEALAHAGDSKSAGAFNAGALSIGAAVYVIGFAAFWFALEREVVWSRVVAAAALIAVWPLLASVRSLVGIAVVLAVLVALVGVEVRDRGRVEQLGVGRNSG